MTYTATAHPTPYWYATPLTVYTGEDYEAARAALIAHMGSADFPRGMGFVTGQGSYRTQETFYRDPYSRAGDVVTERRGQLNVPVSA